MIKTSKWLIVGCLFMSAIGLAWYYLPFLFPGIVIQYSPFSDRIWLAYISSENSAGRINNDLYHAVCSRLRSNPSASRQMLTKVYVEKNNKEGRKALTILSDCLNNRGLVPFWEGVVTSDEDNSSYAFYSMLEVAANKKQLLIRYACFDDPKIRRIAIISLFEMNIEAALELVERRYSVEESSRVRREYIYRASFAGAKHKNVVLKIYEHAVKDNVGANVEYAKQMRLEYLEGL